MLSEDKIVGSQQSAVGRQEKEFLRLFILKTLWAGLKRIALLVFFYLLLVDKIVNNAVCVKSSFIRILLGNVLCKIL